MDWDCRSNVFYSSDLISKRLHLWVDLEGGLY